MKKKSNLYLKLHFYSFQKTNSSLRHLGVNRKRYINRFFVLFLFCTQSLKAQNCYNTLYPYYSSINVNQYIHINKPNDIDILRKNLINRIWKDENGIPTTYPTSILTNIGSKFFINNTLFTNLERLDEYRVEMPLGFKSYVYFLKPIINNNKLIIVHQGHSLPEESGIRETIGYFINLGYNILFINMPLYNGNIGLIGVEDHNQMQFLETATLNPLIFFIEPIDRALNYVITEYGFTDISMIGVSGGGWATTLYSAIDERIKNSFQVAGTLPNYLKSGPCINGSVGDWEQMVLEIPDSLSYLDLYIMGAYGEGRKQIQVLNQYDSCCFFGINYLTYVNLVEDKINCLKKGAFEVLRDTTNYEHKISNYALQYINLNNCVSSITLSSVDDYNRGLHNIRASNTINAKNKVNDLSRVSFEASNSIIMLPGFEVNINSCGSFVAQIKGCQ